MPVAVIQQVYVNVEINCQQIEQLCDKSYYSISKLVSAQLLSRMEGAIRCMTMAGTIVSARKLVF